MSLNQSGFGVAALALAILVSGAVAGTGVYVVQKQQDKSTNEKAATVSEPVAKQEPTAQPEAKVETLTEDQKILQAANCPTCTIKNKNATVAHVIESGDMGGINIFVAKENNAWKKVFGGNGEVPKDIEEKYSIPTAWADPTLGL